MTGERDGGKTGMSIEALAIHGSLSNEQDADSIYSASAGSMNTEAKWGKGVSKTTYPKEVYEWGNVESYGRNEDMVEMLKVTVDFLVVRRGRSENKWDQPYPSCSPLLINGNPIFTRKGEILKRFHVSKFSEADRHSRDPKSEFNVFQKANIHLYKILGDWTMRYIYENRQELLVSKKYSVYEVAEKALLEFYKFGGKDDIPDWLKLWIKDLSLEELDVDEGSIIRSILYNHIHKTLSSNSIYFNKEHMESLSLEERIDQCLTKRLWSWLRKVKGKDDIYHIDSSILEIFSYRLPDLTLTKLGEKIGFDKVPADSYGRTVLKCTKKQISCVRRSRWVLCVR